MRILIADDDADLMRVVGLYFRNREHLVDDAVNGLEAFTLAVITSFNNALTMKLPFNFTVFPFVIWKASPINADS